MPKTESLNLTFKQLMLFVTICTLEVLHGYKVESQTGRLFQILKVFVVRSGLLYSNVKVFGSSCLYKMALYTISD